MTDTGRESAVTRARLAKAQRLADVLERIGASGGDVWGIDAEGRRAAEALAGVRESSEVTWAIVGDILEFRGSVWGGGMTERQDADDVRLNLMADAVTSVCGWLPLSVRYEAAKAALARVDVYGATCQWCGCVGFHSEVCPGFEINDPARTGGSACDDPKI